MPPADTTQSDVTVSSAGGKLSAAVPWDGADAAQEFLLRHGIRSTAVLDAANRTACIEPWEGTDPQQFQALLEEWARGRGRAR